MAGTQTAAASAAVLELNDMSEMKIGDGSETAEGAEQRRGTSYTPLEDDQSSSAKASDKAPSPEEWMDDIKEGQVNIRTFWESVKAPGTEENLRFAAEVSRCV